jgi:hypothetical protein
MSDTTGRPPFADADDLAELLGEDIEQDSADWKRAKRILRSASNLVRRQTRNDWLDADGALITPLPEDLADITLACAYRYYTNPDAETQWSRQIDDGMDGGGRKVDESGLYLTDSEKATLANLVSDASPVIAGLGTIRTTRGEAACSDMDSEWSESRPTLWAQVTR